MKTQLTTSGVRRKAGCLLLLVLFAVSPCSAQTYVNPVLQGVADAGVIKYAGKYYLGGVATMGDFFVSSDLTHWDNRIHVYDFDTDYNRGTGAKNNQVHSDDIVYAGGLFHLFYSANYWGRDRHIVHIIHATSPNIEGPFYEDRDDQWFENRIDPQLFRDEDGRLYLYMVKFTDGNTIWARPLNADFTFAGDAVQQFSSQPGTWETMDNRVAEGPFVIRYHGRYYMMYNANHTAAEYGNYRLGVCEADTPLGFNPGGKYAYPVVSPQTELMEDSYIDLIRFGGKGYNAVDLEKDTIHFTVSRPVSGKLYLKFAQRGGIKAWLNGHQINTNERADYKLTAIEASWVVKGDNTIVFDRPESRVIPSQSTEPNRNRRSSRLVALALYDLGTATPPLAEGDMLLTPGQPNIVRGPNGWEWWLVYMANQGFRRDQYIDRIHFVNDRLTVSGITGHNTQQPYAPAKPQYSGTSLEDISFADSYLLEVTGVVGKGLRVAGHDLLLPSNMKSDVAHEWRIEKNHQLLTAWVDGMKIADGVSISTTSNETTWIGSPAKVDYISYNEGFDEYGSHFSGWQGFTADDQGLRLTQGESFKGNAATDYELSVCFSNSTSASGAYGVYAAYTDAKNYVRVFIDASTQQLVTEQCVKGKVRRTTAPLAYDETHYPDIKYTDSYDKQYRFDTDTWLSAIHFPRLDADNDTYARSLSLSEAAERAYNEDMAGNFDISWLEGDTWRPLSYNKEAGNNAWQTITFPQVKTRGIRFINSDPQQGRRLIYKLKTTRAFESDMQLRVEKRGADINVFVGNRLLSTVKEKTAVPTRVGLYSDGNADVRAKSLLFYPVFNE